MAADCRRKAPNRPAVMLSGGASPEVETSRPDGTFSGANRTGSRPSDHRDSSTVPAASLGMTITSSVTLSGASAESKGLEFAEHAPVRFVRIYANPPSGPLDCARGDSLCCLVERRGVNPEVETPRPIGAFTFTSHTRSSQTAKDETKVQSFARRGCGLPAQSADSTGENPRLRSG